MIHSTKQNRKIRNNITDQSFLLIFKTPFFLKPFRHYFLERLNSLLYFDMTCRDLSWFLSTDLHEKFSNKVEHIVENAFFIMDNHESGH